LQKRKTILGGVYLAVPRQQHYPTVIYKVATLNPLIRFYIAIKNSFEHVRYFLV
jgi:hypothetical protein